MATRGGTVTVVFLGDAAQLDATLAHVTEATGATADAVGDAGTKAGKSFSDGLDKGTSKLGSLFSSFGNQLGNFGLPFSGEMSKIGNELGDVETKGKGFKDAMSTVGAVGVAALAGIALESVHLADSFDKAQASLKTAVAAAGGNWETFQKQASAATKTTGALVTGNADEVDDALATLTTATNNPKEALKDLGLVENMAALKHMSLADASQQLAKILGGNTRVIQQWGINLDIGSTKLTAIQKAEEALQSAQLSQKTVQDEVNDGQLQGVAASSAQEKAQLAVRNATLNLSEDQSSLGDVMDALNQRTKDAASNLGDTLAGKITIAKNALHNLGVEFGEILLPAIDKVLAAGSAILGFFQRNRDAALVLGAAIGGPLVASMIVFASSAVASGLAAMGKLTMAFVNIIPNIQAFILKSAAASKGMVADDGTIVTADNTMMLKLQSDTAALESSFAARTEGATASAEAIEASYGGIEAANTSLAASFATASAGIVASIASVAAPLALVLVAYKAYTSLKNGPEQDTVAPTGNLKKAEGEYNATGFGTLSGKNSAAVIAAAKEEVANYEKSKRSGLGGGASDLNTMTAAQEKVAQSYVQAAIIGEKGLTGLALSAQKLQVRLDQLEANPKATQNQIASAQAAYNVAEAKAGTQTPGSTLTPLGATPTPGGGAGTTTITAGEAALEVVAKNFQGALTRAGQGGTGITQQAQTVAAINAALARSGQESSLINSLNATKNPTLTGLAQSIETTWSTLTNKLAGIIDTDTQKGQSEVQKLQSAQSSTSIDTLRSAVTGEAKTSFDELTKELTSVHSKALNGLVASLKANWATTMSDYTQVMGTLATIAQADAAAMAAQVTSAQTTQLGNVGAAQVTVSGLQSQQVVDQLNNTATQINDNTKVTADQSAQMVDAINATTTAITDAANAQVSSIQDATQTQVDTLGERGLYGLALVAQQAKVALDQQKAIDDANIASAQAHLDQVTAQQTAAVAAAQTAADQVQAQQDANVAATQATADATAINGAIQAAAAQAGVDATGIVNAINVGSATAHADATQYSTSNVQAAAQAAEKLAQSNADNSAAQMAAQQQVTTNAINAANQNAQNAYNQASAYATQQEALANQTLSNAQNNANVQDALAQQNLSSIQSQAQVTEAKLTSIYNVDQEMANVEYAGSGMNIYITSLASSDEAALTAAGTYIMRYRT